MFKILSTTSHVLLLMPVYVSLAPTHLLIEFRCQLYYIILYVKTYIIYDSNILIDIDLMSVTTTPFGYDTCQF